MRAIILALAVSGCAADGLKMQDTCSFGFSTPSESGTTCGVVASPHFDFEADVPSFGHVESTFSAVDYDVIAGEGVNLAIASQLSVDGSTCDTGTMFVDALPPDWRVRINATCGLKRLAGELVGHVVSTQQ